MSLFQRIGFSLFAGVIGFIGPVMAQSTRELGFVGTWRMSSPPSDEMPPTEVCGRECTITFDGKAFSVKTRQETRSYIAGKSTKKSIVPGAGMTVEITTGTEWDKSTLVITRTAVTNASTTSQLTSRLTVQGDRLMIELSPPPKRGASKYIYTRVK
jgi:hypothetical protein